MTEKQKWLRKKLSRAERIGVMKRSMKTLKKELQWAQTLGGLSMHAHMKDTIDEMTLEELEELVSEIKTIIKDRKEQDKENAKIAFENNVSIGDRVLFVFKGEEVEGQVQKINDKSFTAIFEFDGEVVKKPIKFHLYRGNVVESEEPEVEAEEGETEEEAV